MNDRMLIGIIFLVAVFLFISVFLLKLFGVFAIPIIIIVGISGVAGWVMEGEKIRREQEERDRNNHFK